MLLESGGERFGWEVNLNVGVCEGDEPVCKKGGGSSATYDFGGKLAISVILIENIAPQHYYDRKVHRPLTVHTYRLQTHNTLDSTNSSLRLELCP